MKQKLKIATVCTGVGAPEQAIKELEIEHEIVFACEKDKYARQTYLANFRCNAMFEDMTTQDWRGEDKHSDLFIGGIPCQAFSLAGKRLGELDPRGLLFYNFYDYVKIQQPKYFIIENVKGLLSDNKGRTFQQWMELLGASVNYQYNMINHEDSLMYNLHWTVLNSKDFGVPQNRERVFLIGIRKDLPNEFRFPIGEPLKIRLKDVLEPVVDEKYYLSDDMLGKIKGWNSNQNPLDKIFTGDDIMSCVLARGDGDGEIHAGMKLLKVGYVNQDTQASAIYDTNGSSPALSAGTHGYAQGYIAIKEATKQAVVVDPVCVAMRGRDPKNPSNRKCGPNNTQQTLEPNTNGTTNTITSVQKDNLIFDSRIRRLTPLECFRLQGFPDSYVKPCSDTQTYKQAGNSITVHVIKAVLKNLLES